MKDRHLDIVLGMVVGAVIGLFFPLEGYRLPLILVALYLGVRRLVPAR
ncbi:MAG: hypothetical protein HY597_06290 [Candidatus Omnitrophica bacterium]|jgi:hypothetical protein|nr:hypothetical protein [Candidatus Omnitrophota bacterium]